MVVVVQVHVVLHVSLVVHKHVRERVVDVARIVLVVVSVVLVTALTFVLVAVIIVWVDVLVDVQIVLVLVMDALVVQVALVVLVVQDVDLLVATVAQEPAQATVTMPAQPLMLHKLLQT